MLTNCENHSDPCKSVTLSDADSNSPLPTSNTTSQVRPIPAESQESLVSLHLQFLPAPPSFPTPSYITPPCIRDLDPSPPGMLPNTASFSDVMLHEILPRYPPSIIHGAGTMKSALIPRFSAPHNARKKVMPCCHALVGVDLPRCTATVALPPQSWTLDTLACCEPGPCLNGRWRMELFVSISG